MSNRKNVVRAWTNPAFRSTLSANELAALPVNPAGETDLDAVVGGNAEGKALVELMSKPVTETGNYGTESQGLCAPNTWYCG